ncbi:hypothetical protein ACNQUF_12240, partial [Corynebacterium diphtheriae]
GYEQVRSIAAALAGDRKAADVVHLELPETGVCTPTSVAAATPQPSRRRLLQQPATDRALRRR